MTSSGYAVVRHHSNGTVDVLSKRHSSKIAAAVEAFEKGLVTVARGQVALPRHTAIKWIGPDPEPIESEWQPFPKRVKHIKRGTTYRVLGMAKIQTETPLLDNAEVCIYFNEGNNDIWVRPKDEMTDGRFEPVKDDK